MPFASAALSCLPCKSTAEAAMRPVKRGRRCVPPPPGKRPISASGRPTLTDLLSELAKRPVQASTSSKPPPSARPFSAAATGLPHVSSSRNIIFSLEAPSNNSFLAASGSAFILAFTVTINPPISSRSAPAQKAFLPEVMTAPLMLSSVLIISIKAAISPIEPSLSTFMERPGISNVARTMPSLSFSILKFFIVLSLSI